ncbi:SIR2 family protein [Sphingobacterium oryzagri]|uniref:SIR2 family protein n=1 Tax=Sphingobacterium oryzagri TaxID=3025669 RepID=A0ABY7WJV8_9SPHI|nr:SIR2 family protein [Sphingobacterium sp. KACC 22765]WDF68683.1 SIR2 family protein [Sphingobacterium sp. KACC 22765]
MDNDKFKKIIESCHLNFLIGSGASRNYFATLGNVEDLLTELAKAPEGKERDILETSIKKDYFDKAISGNLYINNIAGIEDAAVVVELENTKANYRDFLVALNIILLRRRSNIISRQANLFTTNMDIFLDVTLEEINVEYNDGYSGKLNPVFSTSNYHKSIFQKSPHYENKAELPLFNLYKMHGSVTWKSDGNQILFDSQLEILRDIYKAELRKPLINEFSEGDKPKSIKDLIQEAGRLEQDDSFSEFLNSYDKLEIINPTKDKFSTTTVQYNFYELLRMYSNELEKENSVLFVLGFSFADEHIREITKRVANSNPTLLICIFAYDESSKTDIEQKLNLSQIKFKNVEVIVGGSLFDLNAKWFKKLAIELDSDQFASKRNDIVANVNLPEAEQI